MSHRTLERNSTILCQYLELQYSLPAFYNSFIFVSFHLTHQDIRVEILRVMCPAIYLNAFEYFWFLLIIWIALSIYTLVVVFVVLVDILDHLLKAISSLEYLDFAFIYLRDISTHISPKNSNSIGAEYTIGWCIRFTIPYVRRNDLFLRLYLF